MKPEARKVEVINSVEEYAALGIPGEWVEPLQKLGYTTIEKLKEVEKPGKLANDLNGYKKKNKLDLPGVSPEAVSSWLSAQSTDAETDKNKEYIVNEIEKTQKRDPQLLYEAALRHLVEVFSATIKNDNPSEEMKKAIIKNEELDENIKITKNEIARWISVTSKFCWRVQEGHKYWD